MTLDAATQAAIEADAVVPRDFLWITAKHRTTGADVSHGMWSDAGTISAGVKNPITGATDTRTFEGAGGLIQISDIQKTLGLTVNTVQIVMSQIDTLAETIIRGLDPKYANVEVYRGWLNPVSYLLVAPALIQFRGFIDAAPIITPAEGGEGSITLTCASYTQEFTRSNSSKRSDADQKLRAPNDKGLEHVAVVGEWEINWGIPVPPETE